MSQHCAILGNIEAEKRILTFAATAFLEIPSIISLFHDTPIEQGDSKIPLRPSQLFGPTLRYWEGKTDLHPGLNRKVTLCGKTTLDCDVTVARNISDWTFLIQVSPQIVSKQKYLRFFFVFLKCYRFAFQRMW